MAVYSGVTFNNLRKAIYLLFFGADPLKDKNGKPVTDKSGKQIYGCDNFASPKYKYIVPLQGNFDNPLEQETPEEFAYNTFVEYWIDRDISLTQDDYTEDEEGNAVNRQKCVATVLLRFIGKDAEDWAKSFRHMTKRAGVGKLFYGVCGAERFEYTMPIIPRRINFFGKNSQIAFDVRFKLYYDECILTGWKPLEGINIKVEGHVCAQDMDVKA